MKKLICLFLLFSSAMSLYAQDECDCFKNLTLLKEVVETNYAGYQYKMNMNGDQLTKFYDDLLEESKKEKYQNYNCARLLNAYITAFEDKHTRIYYSANKGIIPAMDDDQKLALFKVINEHISLPIQSIDQYVFDPEDELNGLYVFKGDTCLVFKDQTLLRDYVGVIWNTEKDHWSRGDVKFELKINSKNQYDYYLYNDNYLLNSRRDVEVDNQIADWVKIVPTSTSINPDNKSIESFSSDSTLYLRLSSFEISNKSYIDSFLEKNKEALSRTPNLILDLRGNGGGADGTFNDLIPYLYTDPIRMIGVDFLCSQNTINDFEEFLQSQETPNPFWVDLLDRMKLNKGKYIHLYEDKESIINIDTVYPYPQNIYLLVDRRCASSAEEFILIAKQSSKVVILGENTAGCLDFSNLVSFIPEKGACNDWWTLEYASSISQRLPENPVDLNGIAPDIYLSKGTDWLKEVYKLIDK